MLTPSSSQAVVTFMDGHPDPAEVLRMHLSQMTLPQKAACEALLREVAQLRKLLDSPTKISHPSEAPSDCQRCAKIAELFTYEPSPISAEYSRALQAAYVQLGATVKKICGT